MGCVPQGSTTEVSNLAHHRACPPSVVPLFDMRRLKVTALWLSLAAVVILLVAGWIRVAVNAPPAPLAVSAKVTEYTSDRGQLRARIGLTNFGRGPVVTDLGFRCEVETTQGFTNYTAGSPRTTLFLRSRKGTTLGSHRLLVPLPADTRRWCFALSARPQTSKERIVSLLFEVGILDYRKVNQRSLRYRWLNDAVPEGADQGWKEIRSGWMELPPVVTSQTEQSE